MRYAAKLSKDVDADEALPSVILVKIWTPDL